MTNTTADDRTNFFYDCFYYINGNVKRAIFPITINTILYCIRPSSAVEARYRSIGNDHGTHHIFYAFRRRSIIASDLIRWSPPLYKIELYQK